MSALPPGYTRCPNDAGHIYPSYLPECNVCAELRARGNAVAPTMVNLDTSEPPVPESVWPKVTLFAVIAVVVLIAAIGFIKQAPEVAQKTGVNPPPIRQVIQNPGSAFPQRSVSSLPAGSPAIAPVTETGFATPRSVPEAIPNPVPAPTPTKGNFTPMAGDLGGHWELKQADVGGTVANLDISPVGDTYAVLVQANTKNPHPNNIGVISYDGTRLHLQANWAMLGGTDYKLNRVGPSLFEGSASLNGKKIYPLKMVRSFE